VGIYVRFDPATSDSGPRTTVPHRPAEPAPCAISLAVIPPAHGRRTVSDLIPAEKISAKELPLLRGPRRRRGRPDPWLPGYFLASNSTFAESSGPRVERSTSLKDITDRKPLKRQYRTLVSNVQEGVFISTPQGRFLDLTTRSSDLCYPTRESLLALDSRLST